MKKVVLITGIAGTLGKAFTRLLREDYIVAGIDSSEWAVAEFQQEFPDVTCVLGDYSNYKSINENIDYIIHCAAYKHVDLGEQNIGGLIKNNLVKMLDLATESVKGGSEFLFISTDKAVEPISAYGFTKALGEKITLQIGGSVARLGNIVGSTGSVIPVWEKCIREKQPIKITDENMTRYMIEDMEAVNQIWMQFLKGEKLIIPEMGEPVRLLDILANVLKKHGYERPEDYEPGVTTIGIRQGEKLEEKLRWDWE